MSFVTVKHRYLISNNYILCYHNCVLKFIIHKIIFQVFLIYRNTIFEFMTNVRIKRKDIESFPMIIQKFVNKVIEKLYTSSQIYNEVGNFFIVPSVYIIIIYIYKMPVVNQDIIQRILQLRRCCINLIINTQTVN